MPLTLTTTPLTSTPPAGAGGPAPSEQDSTKPLLLLGPSLGTSGPRLWTPIVAELADERQDGFSAHSHQLTAKAWDEGRYDDLVVPGPKPRKGEPLTRDQGIRPDSTAATLAELRPVFRPDGSATAGNASPLSDGASAVWVGSEAGASRPTRYPPSVAPWIWPSAPNRPG